jgi:hypothetical protein
MYGPFALCSLEFLVSASITASRVIHMIKELTGQRKVLASAHVRCRDRGVAKKL